MEEAIAARGSGAAAGRRAVCGRDGTEDGAASLNLKVGSDGRLAEVRVRRTQTHTQTHARTHLVVLVLIRARSSGGTMVYRGAKACERSALVGGARLALRRGERGGVVLGGLEAVDKAGAEHLLVLLLEGHRLEQLSAQ